MACLDILYGVSLSGSHILPVAKTTAGDVLPQYIKISFHLSRLSNCNIPLFQLSIFPSSRAVYSICVNMAAVYTEDKVKKYLCSYKVSVYSSQEDEFFYLLLNKNRD